MRSPAFGVGERFRFLLIPNDSLDGVRQGKDANPAVLFGSPDQLTITCTGRGAYSLAWKGAAAGEAGDQHRVFQIEASDTPFPLGSTVQDQPEVELIDLRCVDPAATIQVSFEVYREAASE